MKRPCTSAVISALETSTCRSVQVLLLISAFFHSYHALEKIHQLTADLGQNLTLPCKDPGDDETFNSANVEWIFEGTSVKGKRQSNRIRPDGSLALVQLRVEDAGIYECSVEPDVAARNRFRVNVRTPPPALVNVSVEPSSVLALLLWSVSDDGGYPVLHFEGRFKLKYEKDIWHPITPKNIAPNVRQIDVYHLHPNSTYVFQIWATNQLGPGEPTERVAKTRHDEEEIELAKLLLEGAETFDTRIWVGAVVIVMGTLAMLAGGTFYLLYKECKFSSLFSDDDDDEVIELVPNIILNPAYYVEPLELDENFNDHFAMRMNNNTVIQPVRV
ncbi:fibronectin type III domain-containing protein [Neocloeon triangulifer]|uniref:fibronectin type III domain-containing protein n=1 Tax=Neocloeon triangulifer TaxID=2078957 RepID=UPI00286EEBB9|nr:fibronectin type III domain-containing protein [Neocloeon triangulifer]